jgi:cytochrome c oxidase subunit 3
MDLPAGSAGGVGMTAVLPVARRRLGMWLFVIADGLTFASILLAYAYLRIGTSNWPLVFHVVPSLLLGALMTLVLLASSAAMFRAVSAIRRRDITASRRWVICAVACGLVFAFLHAHEWNVLIRAGVTPFDNPWGVPLFGATFFTITGFHLTHVVAGVLYLTIVAARMRTLRSDDVEAAALYWHFVDVVWWFIFPLIYLMSANV